MRRDSDRGVFRVWRAVGDGQEKTSISRSVTCIRSIRSSFHPYIMIHYSFFSLLDFIRLNNCVSNVDFITFGHGGGGGDGER